jgi:hypothetical protein
MPDSRGFPAGRRQPRPKPAYPVTAPKVRLTFGLDPTQWEAVRRTAEEAGWTMSEVVRWAVDQAVVRARKGD